MCLTFSFVAIDYKNTSITKISRFTMALGVQKYESYSFLLVLYNCSIANFLNAVLLSASVIATISHALDIVYQYHACMH